VLLSCSANLAVPLSSMKTNLIFAAIVLVARTAIAQAAGVGGSAALLVLRSIRRQDQNRRVQQLPSVAAIANAAESQGVAIRQIFLTSGQVTVVYKYNDGRITTLCYQLPPAVGLPPHPQPRSNLFAVASVAPGNSGRCPCFADCGLRSAGVRLRFRLLSLALVGAHWHRLWFVLP